MNKPIIALLYDFDKTLSPRDMQEYGFIEGIGMTPEAFWGKCEEMSKRAEVDSILAYMYNMLREAEGKMLLARSTFNRLGESVELFPGVQSWFTRINAYAAARGAAAEHYILSSGLKEIIEGVSIAHEFKKIYAAEFFYNDRGVPVWPAMAVNYTSKTQFLYRINKGVLDPTDHSRLNEYIPENEKRIPFGNMIYFGDGMTDVPCMKLVRSGGGHSVAVYRENREQAVKLLRQKRVDYIFPADYSEGSALEVSVKKMIDSIICQNLLAAEHSAQMQENDCCD